MMHIKETWQIKTMPRLNKIQAERVWEIADNLLPIDCFWREKGRINLRVLKIIGHLYLSKKIFAVDEICRQCAQQKEILCHHKAKHLH